MSNIFDMEASMSFRERAAWVMGILMALAGIYYLHIVRELGPAALPTEVLTPYTGLVVVAWVVAQIALNALSPREANAPADERERPLLDRAGNWSGWVLGLGVIGSLWAFHVDGDGVQMVHLLVGSLILSQVAEYAFQIFLLRRNG